MNHPRRNESDGWGGEDEGTRRVDDCIDELSFGGKDNEDDQKGVGER